MACIPYFHYTTYMKKLLKLGSQFMSPKQHLCNLFIQLSELACLKLSNHKPPLRWSIVDDIADIRQDNTCWEGHFEAL